MRHLPFVLIGLLCHSVLACDTDRIQSVTVASEEHLQALVECLASADPALRDQLAYTSLASLLREQRPAPERLAYLSSQLEQLLQRPDPDGVAHPFAILVLAEIARTDRIEAWMDTQQRQHLVDLGSDYLQDVSDYRGFDPQVGWRHGVAHGADLAMQLSLNPALGRDQLLQLMRAIGQQVAPDQAYRFGEPARLARPVLFIAARDVIEPDDWQTWFAELADPAPLPGWDAVWNDAAGLARRHNLRAFALEIYLNASLGEKPGIEALEPHALDLLRALR